MKDPIIEAYLAGHTVKEVSKIHQISVYKVRNTLSKFGIKAKKRSKITIQDRCIIWQYRKDGLKIKDIVSLTGWSVKTICRVIRECRLREPSLGV